MSKVLSLSELYALAGQRLAPSDWFDIDQQRIDQFARCTDDQQYIHVDAERMRTSPFGGTIAHGFLSLSLLVGHRSPEWPHLEGAVMTLNYGLNRVRFLNPVKVDARLRYQTKILAVTEKSPGRILITAELTLEVQGESNPALVAETLAMIITDQA